MNASPHYEPDVELVGLVARLRDRQLDAEGKRRLEERLRDEPQAREYCADCLLFDADMREVLQPQSRLEWSETRKVILGKDEDWEVQRNQSVRYGRKRLEGPAGPVRWRWWWLVLIVAVVGLAGLLPWLRHRAPVAAPVAAISPLELQNSGFEATDLTFAADGVNSALVDWQDYFTTSGASLAEIGRVSEGRIFSKSGRNVARLRDYAYLTQRLRRKDGSALLARPGLTVVVRGWAYVAGGPPPYGLKGALRFVATSKPGMIQYEVARDQIVLEKGGWQVFRLKMTLPEDLVVAYSDIDPGLPSPPKLDVNGRELTLSLDSRCIGGELLLDALEIGEESEGPAKDR
ncbi:hypothetical protein KBB96_09825 [Luteolibacter ambystomatis]|uniref:Uncharacterized protein n=1 Tax=Luteolibacter ambystomatis TaxID=2824561 RepID=A0A975J384_9BACT|nr:hypothetical protein [Luteolibacter ambystomatis]QUE53179.1 hypothetical protein KBB96_09825 [Luteolibacter ambystomatis]